MNCIKLMLSSALIFVSIAAQAQLTRVMVRAKAKDAKFVGSALGVHVTIRDHITGEVLAKGTATGGPGNTKNIMQTPVVRGQKIADSSTSGFEATIELTEPTFVDIEVTAPLNRKNGTKKVTTQVWLIPGKDILGDGIILEIPGFIVDVLSPTTQRFTKLSSINNGKIPLTVSITMACGCVISKGGLWDSEAYTVKAIVKQNGKKLVELPLNITDVDNIFATEIPVNAKGDYEVHVYAYDPKTGNTGLDRINFTIF